MPPKTAKPSNSRPSAPRPPADITGYLLDEDFADGDPFRSPSPDANSKKRKGPDGLGIDEAVEVKKRARVPRVKLDEERLLSDKGIPELRKRAKRLRLKGKGHEFSDAARLLSLYQLWLDDLFPKARFLDALAMVEKTGHKKGMRLRRMEWINEGKPKATSLEDSQPPRESAAEGDQPAAEPTRIAPIFEKRAQPAGRPSTPTADGDVFGDDIYDATPRAKRTAAASGGTGGEPDEDDLDALMAMAEAEPSNRQGAAPGRVFNSIFGGDGPARPGAGRRDDPEDDDLDALMAEAEAESGAPTRKEGDGTKNATGGSIFGDGKPRRNADQGDEDDLEALLAETEAGGPPQKGSGSAPREQGGAGGQGADSYMEDEEAMAEMEGLWD